MSSGVPFDHAVWREECIARFRAMSDAELLGTLAGQAYDRGFAGARMTYIGRMFGEIEHRKWDMSALMHGDDNKGRRITPCMLRNNILVPVDLGIPRDMNLNMLNKETGFGDKQIESFMTQLTQNADLREVAKKRMVELYEREQDSKGIFQWLKK